MHGNEPVGREMLVHLASYLLHARPLVSRVADLLATTEITLIPTINPDGFDRGTEGACSGATSSCTLPIHTFSHFNPPFSNHSIQVATTKLGDTTKARKT